MHQALFPVGQTLITPGARDVCAELGVEPLTLLRRHVSGDWSEMSADDQRANRAALEDGSRVFSGYTLGQHRFFVITEADRAATTILLASEY